MSILPETSLKPALAKGLAALAAMVLILVGVLNGAAQAHGSVTDPPSRNYGCWQRWGSDFQNPDMATLDPMCWQAWQADPQAMWNWTGLYREGVAGRHEAAIPDGQLCSGGRTQAPRYNAMDTVGAWKATNMPNQFTLTLTDQAQHGADYIRVYLTKQGFDSTAEPMGWDDLELVTTSPRIAPASTYRVPVNAGTRTGRHVMYTIWQASHLDQSYYICSDVNFGGGTDPTPTVTPTVTPTATPTPTPGTGACTAALRTVSSWSGGFQAEVTVTASTAISSWSVGWNLAAGQSITSLWSGTSTVTGSAVTVRNAAWNGAVSAGQSTTFGWVGAGAPSTPTLTCST
jgi:chitin-binding protein